MEDEQQVSWMAIADKAPVVDKGGNEIGHVDAVLGDDDDGIFHGIALNLKGWGNYVELPADRVTRITTERVYTDLETDEGKKLEHHEPDRWFEFKGATRFLKRAKWHEDE